MQKIRINDLARELEVKSKAILDALIQVGVTEKKTHSSSIEVDEAERVKKYFAEHAEPSSGRSSRAAAPAADEFKSKIDLSHISKPGDVRKLVEQRAVQSSAGHAPVSASGPDRGGRSATNGCASVRRPSAKARTSDGKAGCASCQCRSGVSRRTAQARTSFHHAPNRGSFAVCGYSFAQAAGAPGPIACPGTSCC